MTVTIMTSEQAFAKYLLETFEEEFDASNIDHLTKLAIFEAGYEAALG